MYVGIRAHSNQCEDRDSWVEESTWKTVLHCAYVLMYKCGQFAPKKHTVPITAAVIN